MKGQHVVPHTDGWAVRKEGSQRASSISNTKREAVEKAKGIAKNEHAELFIHGKDGKIMERNSYGHDPFPPRG